MNRRHFIQVSGVSLASVLTSNSIFALPGEPLSWLIHFPDEVSAIINGQSIKLTSKDKEVWTYQALVVDMKTRNTGLEINIQAPKLSLSEVVLRWKTKRENVTTVLNDHWERTYGDISWHTAHATVHRRLPGTSLPGRWCS